VSKDDAMGYVDIRSQEWNLEGGKEHIRWIDVVDGDGQIQIGIRLH